MQHDFYAVGETGPVWKLSQREDQNALNGQERIV